MTSKPFFSRYNANFTMTPNTFFDLVVTEASTLNEVRAVSYVIRKTIGWNKKFEYITRSQFVAEAKISNGQLTKTLESCLKKGWLLCFRTGERGKEENYYFLNDTLNNKLVAGLERNLFKIEDLQYKSEEGLIQLLNRHGIEYDPEVTTEETWENAGKDMHEEATSKASQIEEQKSGSPVATNHHNQENGFSATGTMCPKEGYGVRRGTESVGVRNPDGYPYGGRRGRGTETVEVNGPLAQEHQGLPALLNTDLKYNILNTKNKIQQHHQRYVPEDSIGDRSGRLDDVDVVVPVSKHQSQNHEELKAAIFQTARELQLPMNDYLAEQLTIAGEGKLDRIVAGMHAAKQFASTKKVENWCGLLIYAIRHGHQPGPGDLATLAFKAKEEKYKDVYQ